MSHQLEEGPSGTTKNLSSLSLNTAQKDFVSWLSLATNFSIKKTGVKTKLKNSSEKQLQTSMCS